MKYILTFFILIIYSSDFSFSQNYYYTATDDDSVTYVAASGKLLVLVRDAGNNLNLVGSKTIRDINYRTAAVSQNKLLLTSTDTAYIFDINDRLNPVYLAKKYFGNIARGEKFGDYFIIVKRETSGHSVIWIDTDTIRVYATLDRSCNCYTYSDIMCSNLTFSYPYAFYIFSANLLETWEFDNQTKNFYLIKLDDYTPSNYAQFQIASSSNYVFLLLCRDLGGGYYTKYISKMEIEADTLMEVGVINQSSVVPTVGGDWDISEGFHRIVSSIFKFNTPSYNEGYSYDTNIDLLINPLPIITDNYVYQCGSDFYYSYRTTYDSLIFKEFIYFINVEFISLNSKTNGKDVLLNWQTATETNNYGFEIQRNTENTKWTTIGFKAGKGTTTEPQSYSFTDKNLQPGKYSYRLKQTDFDGTYNYSNIVEAEVAPTSFSLSQNYPNPFNPSTNINYSINSQQFVSLKVYDVLGNEVSTLVNEEQPAGNYSVEFNRSNLSNGISSVGGYASGVYFYQLKAGNYIATKKLILLK